MKLSDILLIATAVLIALAVFGVWYRKNRGTPGDQNKKNVTENVANLNDRFNRARQMSQDGK